MPWLRFGSVEFTPKTPKTTKADLEVFVVLGGDYFFRWLARMIISRRVLAMVMALTPVGS